MTIGRQKTVMLYDNVSQQLFDNDVRFDGFGWAIKHGIFGLNLSQYVLGSTNQGVGVQSSTYTQTEASQANPQTQSHFGVLYSFQPWAQFKVTEDISSIFAVAYHNWSGTGAKSTSGWYNNALHGGSGASANETTNASQQSPVVMDNTQQWHFLSDTSLPFNLRLLGEFIHNKKTVYGTRLNPTNVQANRNAWAATLAWGKPKKAGEFSLAYTYGKKGIASVINSYTNGDTPGADNVTHLFEGKYFWADKMSFTAKAQFFSEMANLGGDGLILTGTNAGRNQRQQRFEFVTAIQI